MKSTPPNWSFAVETDCGRPQAIKDRTRRKPVHVGPARREIIHISNHHDYLSVRKASLDGEMRQGALYCIWIRKEKDLRAENVECGSNVNAENSRLSWPTFPSGRRE